jgi:acyl dehydratase
MTDSSTTSSDLLGRKLPAAVIIVERGPVARFAEAVLATSPAYSAAPAAKEAGFPAVPAPPTFAFIAGYWGTLPEEQPERDPEASDLGAILADLRKDGGLVLHGEQEFQYHAPVLVGQRLHSSGVVQDVSVKEGKGGATMTAVKVRTEMRRDDGELAVTQISTFLLRKTPKA